MKSSSLFKKWRYFIYAIYSLEFFSSVNSLPISHNFETDNKIGRIVQRYNIDVNNHRVIAIDYLELHPYLNATTDTIDEYKISQEARDHIKKLNFKEKTDKYVRKNYIKPDYIIDDELKKNPNAITLKTENVNKKSVNSFNFHIFCIDSKLEECEKIRNNLNSVGESLSSQIVIDHPINIFVKTASFCKRMGKACGAVKTFASSTPTAFYALTENSETIPFLYPQALVKQLNIDGGYVDFLSYDISISLNTDINYWFWSDKEDIGKEQIDFQHVIAKEIIHGLGFISGLGQSFKQDYNSIFNIISVHENHPYLLPYFHYGSNGYFNAPIIKNILPLFIFDKFLKVNTSKDTYIPVINFLYDFYESDKIENNYVSLAVKRIEEDYDIYEGINLLYKYADDSLWVFKDDNKSSIPIDTNVFDDWIDGLSGSHSQCDKFFHTARNKDDGIMCTFIDEGVNLFEKNSKLLNEKELKILSTLGFKITEEKEVLQFDEENIKETKVDEENEEKIEDEDIDNDENEDEDDNETHESIDYVNDNNSKNKRSNGLPFSKNKNKNLNLNKSKNPNRHDVKSPKPYHNTYKSKNYSTHFN